MSLAYLFFRNQKKKCKKPLELLYSKRYNFKTNQIIIPMKLLRTNPSFLLTSSISKVVLSSIKSHGEKCCTEKKLPIGRKYKVDFLEKKSELKNS